MRRTGPAPIVLVLAFWVLLYLPRLLGGDTLPARDTAATQLPWRTVWRAQVSAGHLPIWDPHSNQGRLLLANPNAMAAYPGTLLFLAATPEVAAAWHLALHHLLLLLGLYLLARRAGGGPDGAALAAAVVGTGGVAFSLLTFLNAQASFAWSPWALATAVAPPAASAARRARCLAGGALLGLSFLAGEPVVAALTALAWAWLVLATWRPLPRMEGALAVLAAVLVAMPVLLPLAAAYGETARGAMGTPAGALAADAFAPRRWLEAFFPNLLGPPLADASGGFWAAASFGWQRYYPLVFIASTAFVVLPFAVRRSGLRPWWVLTLAGVAFAALPAVTPLARTMERWPGLGGMRFAIKFLLLALLGLGPLLAAGWEGLRLRWRPHGRRAALACLLVLVLLTPAAALPDTLLRPALTRLYPASAASLESTPAPHLARALAGDLAVAAMSPLALAITGPVPAVAVTVTLVADAFAARGVLAFDAAARWAQPAAAAALVPRAGRIAALTSRGAPHDGPENPNLARFWRYRAALRPGYGTRWGLSYVLDRGPDGLAVAREEMLAAAVDDLPLAGQLRAAAALGAVAAVVPPNQTDSSCAQVDGVCVVTLGGAPPSYLAARLLPADGPVAAAATLASPAFEPGKDAVVDGRGGVVELGGGTVRSHSGPPHHLSFVVDSSGPGLLVVQQSYMRAWRARIDGAPARVEPVNGACIGVPLPAGRHRVVLFVDPRSYRLGLAGPLLAAVLALVVRRRG